MIVKNPAAHQRKPKADAFVEVPLLLKKLLGPGAEAQEQEIRTAIFSRLIPPGREIMTKEAAQAVLEMGLSQTDLDRMHELAVKNQNDALTPSEREELKGYIRVAPLIDLLRAKARNVLANRD